MLSIYLVNSKRRFPSSGFFVGVLTQFHGHHSSEFLAVLTAAADFSKRKTVSMGLPTFSNFSSNFPLTSPIYIAVILLEIWIPFIKVTMYIYSFQPISLLLQSDPLLPTQHLHYISFWEDFCWKMLQLQVWFINMSRTNINLRSGGTAALPHWLKNLPLKICWFSRQLRMTPPASFYSSCKVADPVFHPLTLKLEMLIVFPDLFLWLYLCTSCQKNAEQASGKPKGRYPELGTLMNTSEITFP